MRVHRELKKIRHNCAPVRYRLMHKHVCPRPRSPVAPTSRKNAASTCRPPPGKVVGRGYCEVGMQICREAREVAPDTRLEILIHHRLASLVLGLNGHVYSLWVAATQRSSRRRHGIQKESRVFNEELRVHVVRAVIGVGLDDNLPIRPEL